MVNVPAKALATTPSIARLRVAVIYLIVFLLAYVLYIAPNFTGMGIVNRLAGDGSLLLAAALAVAPAPWLPARAERPSDAGLWVLYLGGYVPSLMIAPFVLGTGWALLPLWLTLGLAFAVLLVLVSRVHLRLPTVSMSVRAYGWLLLGLAGIGVVGILWWFGIPTRIPSLSEVPGARLDFREDLAGAGRLAGYAVWWTGGVVAPLLVAYGLWVRRPWFAMGGFFILALVYASAAFRSMLFIALLVIVLLALIVRVRRDFGATIAILTSLLIVACSAVAAAGLFTPISLLVRRLLVVPGQVMAYYYDAFSTGPVYALSHSILGSLMPRPYELTPPRLIGERYFHDAQVNANGNVWADGMANFGLVGIVGASVALGLFLIAMDTVSRGKPALLTVTLGGIGMWSLINSGLLTSLLTHGLVLMLLLIWLMPAARLRGRPDRALRVAHVTSVHRSDDPRIYLKECATLAEAGYDVTLIAQGSAPAAAVGVDFVSLGEASGRLTRMLVMPVRVLRAARRLRADLYHLHDPELLPLGILLKLLGLRVIYDAHEDLPRQIAYKPYIPGWAQRPVALATGALEQGAARLLDAVVAATPRIAARFPAGKVTLVQNFPLASEFAAGPARPYEERPPLVAYVGRLTREVGAIVMADAARIVAPRRDVRFTLAGPIEPELAETITRRTSAVLVELPGRLGRTEVVALLHDARVGMVLFQPVANYVEAYPTKLFEYMASELPVVASDFPVWREIVAEVDCGLLADPTDPIAVADAIEELLADPERAAAMGRRGRQAVLERYRWEPQGARLVDLYSALLAGVSEDVEVPAETVAAAGT